ncbi:5-oxoprolinase subunit PxpB [Paradesulfitobacterium aromaticivorans]
MAEDKKSSTIFNVLPYGDGAIHVQFGHGISDEVFKRVWTLCERVRLAQDARIIEFVPGYHSVTLFYGPGTTYAEMSEWVHRLNLDEENGESEFGFHGRLIEIPVCYGGEYGPDLEFMARYQGLRPEEVVTLHTKNEYLVYMLGFMPGFPFMGGLDPLLATPRLSKPRTRVPKGSVGIAGEQTGIYPLDSPGGWQLIGRTPLDMFNAEQNPPALVRSGDRVRFVPINNEEYQRLLVRGGLL